MDLKKELDAKHKEILNDIKKNLADISRDENILPREMFFAMASLQQKKHHETFEYISEKDNISMKVEMSKYRLIQMIADIAKSIFKDKYELISMLLAYSLFEDVIDSQAEKIKEIKIDLNGKTQAEIDLMKELFKKSPEELEKLKEQMNE